MDSDVGSSLVSQLIGFLDHARDNGYCIGLDEQLTAQQLCLTTTVTDARLFRWNLRSLICSSLEDWQRFDELFNAYWVQPGRVKFGTSASSFASRKNQSERKKDNPLSGQAANMANQDNDESGNQDESDPGAQKGASSQEALMNADFRDLRDDTQMRQAELLAERLARRVKKRQLRRFKSGQRHLLDLRRTVRKNLRHGGIPFNLAYRKPVRKQPKVVILIDVSRSMAMYSLIFLRFARGLLATFTQANAFAFHTRLTPIGDALKQRDMIRLQHSLVIISQGWSGGTRIGECLNEFNQHYSRELDRQTLLFVVSDGLDTGPAEEMGMAMKQLRENCRRLIWLNPLLGRAGYEPKTAGILAALPFIDLFAPAHNLASLMALENKIAEL